MKKKSVIWKERRRLWCGLPWTFTRYSASGDRLFVESGFLSSAEKEIRLYRVLDISLTRSLIQRLFGLGSVHVESTDKDLPRLEIKNIRNARDVKEMLSEMVEAERKRNRVTSREYMTSADDDPDEETDF